LDSLRSRVYQAIETERQNGNIKNALDCELEITLKKEHYALVKLLQNELSKFFISSSCLVKEGAEEAIVVKKSEYEKCSRCWHRCEDLNEEKICTRCETNMFGDGEIRSFF
jgi:isoleucyl-tRNA synthetase